MNRERPEIKKKGKMTAKEMEIRIANYFNPRVNIIVPNISWGMFLHEIPEDAGIILVGQKNYPAVSTIRQARIKSHYKFNNSEKFNVARLGTLRMWALKQQILNLEKGKMRYEK